MKIPDIFNRRKIKFLEGEIGMLWYNLNQKEKQIEELQKKPVECFTTESVVDEKYILNRLFQHVRAIEEYLEIQVKEEWVDDKFMPPRPPYPKVKTYKAYKIQK